MKTTCLVLGVALIAGASSAAAPPPPADVPVQSKSDPAKTDPKEKNVIVLFDGATLKNWLKTDFGGEGKVSVEDGQLIFDRGESLTGVTWKGPELPKTNYEVSLEAMRLGGVDFFCGIAFPVGKAHTSFVAGGWGGGTCGISSIDDAYGNDNKSTTIQTFKDKQWYKFRLRVTPEKIQVWLDDLKIVDIETADHKFSIHPAMESSLPFGLTSFQTTAAYRNVKLRKLE